MLDCFAIPVQEHISVLSISFHVLARHLFWFTETDYSPQRLPRSLALMLLQRPSDFKLVIPTRNILSVLMHVLWQAGTLTLNLTGGENCQIASQLSFHITFPFCCSLFACLDLLCIYLHELTIYHRDEPNVWF